MPADRSDDIHPPSDRRPPTAAPAADVGLRATVVRYDASPDRRTVYPAGVADHERLTRWLSADDGAFVDLDAVR
ncbi:MAG: hypothetical protein ABEH78_00935 [Haloferacaceae archaeon]